MTKRKPVAGAIHDPDLYAEMSKPFATRAEYDRAVEVFAAGLRALRKECGLANVVYLIADGVEGKGDMMRRGHIGDSAMVMPMLATAFGHERAMAIDAIDSRAKQAEQQMLQTLAQADEKDA